jgi:UDPglucose--hexose-1-phosphate uridylyltransferase
MPELRKNILNGKWVVVAIERGKRPRQLVYRSYKEENDMVCPFCDGNEKMTPPEVLAYRDIEAPNSGNWKVRVVPNKFPAFTTEENAKHKKQSRLFLSRPALGVHEVIVHSPDHKASLAKLSHNQIELVIKAMQERTGELCIDEAIEHVSLITNHRTESGASLPHPHSQLFAGSIVPDIINNELANFKDYRLKNNSCLVCDVIGEEIQVQERIVFDGEGFLVLSPYAARLPFELWILPKEHNSRFETIGDYERACLASALKLTLGTLSQKLNDPPYNLIVHTAPCKLEDNRKYHWHIELVPRLTFIAGFELASDMTINIVSPETAAKFLTGAE